MAAKLWLVDGKKFVVKVSCGMTAPARRSRFVKSHQDFSVQPAAENELKHLIALVSAKFPHMPISEPMVMDVHARSASILSIRHFGEPAGVLGALFLNEGGLRQLLEGSFIAASPPMESLAARGESAAAVYVWMFLAPHGWGAAVLGNIMQWLRDNGHGGADLYGRPTSAALERLHARYGSHPLSEGNPIWVHRHDGSSRLPADD
jgi:hypothetical protein